MQHIKFSELTGKFYFMQKKDKVDISDDIKEITDHVTSELVEENKRLRLFGTKIFAMLNENKAAMEDAKEQGMDTDDIFETDSVYNAVIEIYEDITSIITNMYEQALSPNPIK